MAKCAIGLILFYFVGTLVIIPLVLPWALSVQATKFLKVPVKLRSAVVNPFLWRVTLKGFQIQDASTRALVAFDRLSVDVSCLSLLKKIYRIESVELSGLAVAATLSENGRINLLDLFPAVSPVAAEQKPTVLPALFIDAIVIRDARISFEDKTVAPIFKTVLNDINVTVQNFSTQTQGMTALTLKALIDDRGIINASAQIKPFASPLDLDLNFGLDHYALTVVGPYVGKYTGRGLSEGELDFSTTYRISQNHLTASHKLLIEGFTFGQKVESKDALNLPFGLAVALLEDSQGRIDISLPVTGDLSDPKFTYTHLIGQTARNFFIKLTTAPFSMLGSLIGSQAGSQELGSVKFLPGEVDLSSQEQQKIVSLAQALKQRPKLLLEINGSYDITLDWKAIKTGRFLKEYEALHKETSRSEYWILQTLYQRHYGIRQLWKLTKHFKIKGGYDYEKLNPEIRRQLSEDAFPDKSALNELASGRAKVVYEALLKEHVDPRRVRIVNNQEQQASLGFVPLIFTLTALDQQKE